MSSNKQQNGNYRSTVRSRANPVAKNLTKFNKSAIMVDRKKELKKTGSFMEDT